jgi:hypothetical protein
MNIKNKIEKNIPFNKKLIKLENGELIIPTINNYYDITKYNYSLLQLKTIAKFYKLKIIGNKKELLTRIFIFLCLSYHIIKIQKIFRGVLQRNFNFFHGPAYKNKKLCTNNTDFITMEELNDIKLNQFFSYKDNDNFIYGFDMASIYSLIKNNKDSYKNIQNPYNRNLIPNYVIKNIKNIIRLGKILKKEINLEIEDDNCEISDEKNIELRALTLFQNIDALGNYSNPQWFLSLNRIQLLKFMRELIDIWNYRAQLSIEIKQNICPPNGDPFRNLSGTYMYTEQNLNNIKKVILEVLEKLVNNGIDRDSQSLGAYYVLGSLTLVNENAASSLPWLFQSVSYF